jgi:glycosyltransferase involved in cell wall biosynthesis
MISVIIPTFQRPEELLGRALPSVFTQTVQDQEILVIGDGTDPVTVAGMRELMHRLPYEERIVRFWNLPHYQYPEDHDKAWGLYGLAALNHGLDHAEGEWIAVLGDDDEFTSDHHEVLLAAAEQSGADHVYGISQAFKNGAYIGQDYGGWPPGDAQLANGANLWRRSLGYRFDLNCWDRGLTGDADMWTRMYRDGVKFHFEPKVVHRYHRSWP